MRVEERQEGDKLAYSSSIVTRALDSLPEGEVLVKVQYSSLNYKDALSATGNKGVTRNYPHTPGIDAAGIVQSSSVDSFAAGDVVIITGYDLGMNTDGASPSISAFLQLGWCTCQRGLPLTKVWY